MKSRLEYVKNKLDERVKETSYRRKQRRDSISSISSLDSRWGRAESVERKRRNSSELESGRDLVKPKPSPIPPNI